MSRVVIIQRFSASASGANLRPVINAAEGGKICIFVIASGADWESHHSLRRIVPQGVQKVLRIVFSLTLL